MVFSEIPWLFLIGILKSETIMFSFGSDPEFMLVDGNQLKSAIGILEAKGDKNQFYYDNVLAEIAVKPGNNRYEVVSNIKDSLKKFAKLIAPHKFVIKASGEYPLEELDSDQAKIAGCNPEWSGYSFKIITPPEKMVFFKEAYWYFKVPFRTAGGHIHLRSKLLADVVNQAASIHMMDLFLGIPSLFMDTDTTSKNRRKAYGLAGSHRIPEEPEAGFGRIEYRPLGNFWFSSPEHVKLIYDLCDFVLHFIENGGYEKFWSVDKNMLLRKPSAAFECFGYDAEALQKSINTCDKKQAEKFMMIVHNFLPDELNRRLEDLSGKQLPDPYETWSL